MPKEVQVENRRLILSYISDNPGSHMRKIARDLNISLSTLRYHLGILEKSGEISCQKQNNLKVYFLSDKLKPHEKVLTPILQQKHYRDIILAIIEAPGLTFSQIADKLSLGNSSASKYINLLEDKEILFHRKSGREKYYYVNDEKSIKELLTTYKKFVADVSYEVRMPMNAIMGMASLLLEEDLTPEQKGFVETIRRGGEEMMVLIGDLLDFPRAEKKKVNLEHQPFSLRASVEESFKRISVQAEEKGLDLAYTIKYGTPDALVGDPGGLLQVLVNLLSHAVKFTDKGEVSLSISSEALGGNKHQIQFAVKDTGIGLLQEKVDQHFLPCSQVETTINRKRYSEGLATCKDLVELMGGTIWAKSEVDKGPTFYFTVEAEVPEEFPAKSEIPDQSVDNLSEKGPLSILVAEDNPSNQRVLVEILKKMGYRADAVADGREVIEALERRPYDLVFMDVKMPRMDGLETTKEIRKRWPLGPKIVAITAYALEGDREKCLEAGMDGYVAKPVQKGVLMEILRRYSPKA